MVTVVTIIRISRASGKCRSSVSNLRPLPPVKQGEHKLWPLVVCIHGGGWSLGHSRGTMAAFHDVPKLLASLAARGYVVASVNYRLSGEAPFPAAAEDVKTAIRWLRGNAAKYDIDKSKVIAWYGVFDFASLVKRDSNTRSAPSAIDLYLGCKDSECPESVVSAASAVNYIDRSDPPILLIHGTEDKTVPYQQSRAFYDALKAGSVRVELVTIAGAGHGFAGPNQEADSKKAIDKTFAFIDATIGQDSK